MNSNSGRNSKLAPLDQRSNLPVRDADKCGIVVLIRNQEVVEVDLNSNVLEAMALA